MTKLKNLIKNLKIHRPYVMICKKVTRIVGNEIQIAHMLGACILALENDGWDVIDLKKALGTINKIKGEEDG